MLVETKARVGVFAIALGAYLPQFPSLVPEFETQYETFKTLLPSTVEVIDGGIVTTKEQSQAAGDKFRAADVDLVVLQLLTYATSYNMLPAVLDLGISPLHHPGDDGVALARPVQIGGHLPHGPAGVQLPQPGGGVGVFVVRGPLFLHVHQHHRHVQVPHRGEHIVGGGVGQKL